MSLTAEDREILMRAKDRTGAFTMVDDDRREMFNATYWRVRARWANNWPPCVTPLSGFRSALSIGERQ